MYCSLGLNMSNSFEYYNYEGDAQPPEYENVTNLDVNNSPQPEVQNTGTENSDNGHLCSLVQGGGDISSHRADILNQAHQLPAVIQFNPPQQHQTHLNYNKNITVTQHLPAVSQLNVYHHNPQCEQTISLNVCSHIQTDNNNHNTLRPHTIVQSNVPHIYTQYTHPRVITQPIIYHQCQFRRLLTSQNFHQNTDCQNHQTAVLLNDCFQHQNNNQNETPEQVPVSVCKHAHNCCHCGSKQNICCLSQNYSSMQIPQRGAQSCTSCKVHQDLNRVELHEASELPSISTQLQNSKQLETQALTALNDQARSDASITPLNVPKQPLISNQTQTNDYSTASKYPQNSKETQTYKYVNSKLQNYNESHNFPTSNGHTTLTNKNYRAQNAGSNNLLSVNCHNGQASEHENQTKKKEEGYIPWYIRNITKK